MPYSSAGMVFSIVQHPLPHPHPPSTPTCGHQHTSKSHWLNSSSGVRVESVRMVQPNPCNMASWRIQEQMCQEHSILCKHGTWFGKAWHMVWDGESAMTDKPHTPLTEEKVKKRTHTMRSKRWTWSFCIVHGAFIFPRSICTVLTLGSCVWTCNDFECCLLHLFACLLQNNPHHYLRFCTPYGLDSGFVWCIMQMGLCVNVEFATGACFRASWCILMCTK